MLWTRDFEQGLVMNGILILKKKLIELLTQAVREAQKSNKLPQVALPDMELEHPRNPEHGDYAASLSLKLAKETGIKPITIAEVIAEFIPPGPEIGSVAVAPPGFINFVISNDWLTRQVESIIAAGESYSDIHLGQKKKVQLEFVSGNPTGPLHVGHGRGGVLGSTLAHVLTAAGCEVETEYYINDAGSQVDAFYHSLYARYQQALGIDAEMPAEGYFGSYMIELAKEIAGEEGDRFLGLPESEAVSQLGQLGLEKMTAGIRNDLELLGASFDVWFSESSLYESGQYDRAMSLLKKGKHVAEREGATWFVSTALGEDKDNVLVRSDGTPTYFASDIAYHYNKFLERKFDRVINIWGADHQGHVSRMKAVMSALGIPPANLEIIISQMVTLRRGKELVRISKRSGDIITLREVIEEVGSDACRFFFLSRTADSQMDFDLELAKKQSADNPVYYVQYAHARIASILRLAQQKGIDFSNGDTSLLTSEPELTLIRKMALLPELMETISNTLEPHHLAYYAQDVATVFHSFYKQCRVVSQDAELTRARLKLVQAAKIILARTLHLMGMTAPESM